MLKRGTLKDAQKRLGEFNKAWNLDAPLNVNPELNRQADVLCNEIVCHTPGTLYHRRLAVVASKLEGP